MAYEQISFLPRAVPKEDGCYKGKPIEDWGWRDFQNYFDDEYVRKLGIKPPGYVLPKQKAMIKYSFEYWGKEVFKEMIDWTFDNYLKYPKWKSISFSLVCGKHYWANMIAEQAQKRLKYQLDFSDE